MNEPNLPPLSCSTSKIKFRRSKSNSYPNDSPEWFWKLSGSLPQLWIRDASHITPEILAELEDAWRRYQSLNIPGKGDGGSLKVRSRKGRMALEEEYKRLDDDVRRAKEVALAQYSQFVISGRDGSLDYHTDDKGDKKCPVQ